MPEPTTGAPDPTERWSSVAHLTDQDSAQRPVSLTVFRTPGFIAHLEHDGQTVFVPVPADLGTAIEKESAGGGRTDTLRATCSKVDQLISGYQDLLDGGGLLSGTLDIVPGARTHIESKLRDAKEFKTRVCDPVLKG